MNLKARPLPKLVPRVLLPELLPTVLSRALATNLHVKKLILASSVLLSLAATQMVGAFSISSSVGGAPTGVNYLNFNDLPLGSTGGSTANTGNSLTPGTVQVTISPDGQVVTGSVSGQYAAPYLSNNQGVKFGDPNNGPDTTKYLTSGKYPSPGGQVTLTFSADQLYLGLLWGSVDDYNTLSFYKGNTLLKAVTGSQVKASPNGDQGVNGTLYVNINLDSGFDKVVATSSQYAFEFDNVAYNAQNVTIPDGGSLFAVLGLSLVGLAGFARRNKVS